MKPIERMSRRRLGSVLALVSALVVVACEAGPHPPAMTVDPRIELIGVVQYLSGYTLSTRYEFPYVADVLEHFGDYRDHAAVTMFREMSAQGFAFDVVPRTMLSLSQPPRLKVRHELGSDIVLKAGGDARLEAWLDAMRAFARETDFMGFFESHRPLYDSVTAATDGPWQAVVDTITGYFGTELTDVNLILAMLFHHGGFSMLFEDGTRREAYAVIGPSSGGSSVPSFGDQRRIGRMVWQGFAEPTVMGLTDRYPDQLAATAPLFDDIETDMNALGIRDWKTAVNEHVVRALMVRMMTRHFGSAVGGTAFSSEVGRGFKYLPSLWAELARYEAHRDVFPTIAEFYPEIFEILQVELDQRE